MRFLSALLGGVLVVAALASTTTTVPAGAHPPNETDHGVSPHVFPILWSGDEDRENGSAAWHDGAAGGVAAMAPWTDIPFDAPPRAVETWNQGDLGEFPADDPATSVYPPDASLEDGVFIKDAHASIFAVDPSTTALLSPERTPRFVAPEGRVSGVVDYRVAVPADEVREDDNETRRVQWDLRRHEVQAVRLLVDGEVVEREDGTRTPSIPYSSLDSDDGGRHTLTLEADVSVDLERTLVNETVVEAPTENASANETSLEAEPCEDGTTETEPACPSSVNETRTIETVTVSQRTETVTVRDSIDVVAYDFSVLGVVARYPDGDLGVAMSTTQPVLGFDVGDVTVNGKWRVYTARDEAWDGLRVRNATAVTERHSPLHPLQVFAFPFEPGVSSSATILEVEGEELAAPRLPEEVHLDAASESYTASDRIAIRLPAGAASEAVTVNGLVRGSVGTESLASFSEVEIVRSNLTLSVLETTDAGARVRVTLREAETGGPIDTSEREGSVVLDGERVNTGANGTVTRTLEYSTGSVSARYEPESWWTTGAPVAYLGDSDVVHVRGGPFSLGAVYPFVVLVSLFLGGGFLLDRITGWGMWPPWRRL